MNKFKPKPSFLGLFPFIVFVALYIGTGIFLQIKGVEKAFYQLPPNIAMFVAAIFAILLFKGKVVDKIYDFIKGSSDKEIIVISYILLLAGAFSSIAKDIGSVDAVVNFGVNYISPKLFVLGIFFMTCFISFSTGSGAGAIIAIFPIALELANKSEINPSLMAAAVLCGSMFGDNLSIISDTTIIAARTQGSDMKDKFKNNSFYAIPAAILTSILFFLLSMSDASKAIIPKASSINYFKIAPYAVIMLFALTSIDVFIILFLGLLVVSFVGIISRDLDFLSLTHKLSKGFVDTTDLYLLVIITGGVSYMVIKNGGLAWILLKVKPLIKGNKTAEGSIAFLISIVELATANNSISIFICGDIAKSISSKNNISPARSATLLDIFSCVFQYVLPYSLPMIVIVEISGGKVYPFEVLPYMFYPLFLGTFCFASIFGLDIKNIFSCFKLKNKKI